MAQLRAAIRPIKHGQHNGGLITITGEAGIGKSHLVAQLRGDNPDVAWFDCPTDEGSAQGLLPFRTWLSTYFGQNAAASAHDNLQAFGVRFDDLVQATPDRAAAAELDRLFSFLAAFVDIVLPDTLYSRLRPEQRRENFQQAIKALIKAESMLQPVILHIEDGHWLDADSAELIANLLHNVADVSICVIVTAPSQPICATAVARCTAAHDSARTAMRRDAIAQLASAYLGQRPDRDTGHVVAPARSGQSVFYRAIVALP